MSKLDAAYNQIQLFRGKSLRQRIAELENDLQGKDGRTCAAFYADQEIDASLLFSALVLKRSSSQINEIVHTLGIMLALPHILHDDEQVQYVSLGAGNTGKSFDLETNLRIAEFKFTDWKGGPEAIRQNQLFKDLYLLAEFETTKDKYLYFIGSGVPLKFFNGKRALRSVMSHHNKLWLDFQQKYEGQFTKVYEYYDYRKSHVNLVDLATIAPFFTQELGEE